MNTKYMFIVAAMTALLIGATALATADSAFAGKYKSKTQAVSQINDCGNGELPLNVFCSNTASQIQGDYNSPALASNQGATGGNHGPGGD